MILATFSLLLLLLALVLVVVVLLLLLLLKEEYQKHLPVWQSYQIHTVHRKSPNTGALRPSISNGKWDNVLSQEKSKHRGIAAVNFEWQMGLSYSLARSPLCLPGSADIKCPNVGHWHKGPKTSRDTARNAPTPPTFWSK